ncbi:MAG: type II toxin-antitoxin system death-on-curing family toxin [Candidatus Nanopelagicaceae bacterium]|nr:type II toxin-antitoxin system death-on-curing family toxin [Candidatus Nanopelagicaceae bacterium]
MSNHEYLTVADALALHAILIKQYGGSDGVRDMGALESALFRPQTGYYKDLIEEAAALLESLAINHPFIDGNKRVAFAVTDTFLRINGRRITADSTVTYEKLIALFDAGDFKFDSLEKWLREVVKEVD